jgi:hypothetical protein
VALLHTDTGTEIPQASRSKPVPLAPTTRAQSFSIWQARHCRQRSGRATPWIFLPAATRTWRDSRLGRTLLRVLAGNTNRKEDYPMNIFDNKKNANEVAVPEIEVNGDEATVSTSNDVQDHGKKVKLPKTTWY